MRKRYLGVGEDCPLFSTKVSTMPKKSHHYAIARLLEILKKLPTKSPGVTTRDMMNWLKDEGYDCSKRTVERDLSELAVHFQLICNDKSIPYGWHWRPDAVPDIPGLTLTDAMSLSLLEDLLKPLLPAAVLESIKPRFLQARKKLEALSDTSPTARWLDKVRYVPPALPLLPPKIAEGILETVQDALLSDQQLEVEYQRPDSDEPQSLLLHPLGLVQRGPVTYLVATVFDYNDVRIFAVHRIREARKKDELSQRPDGFSLDDYIGHGALHFGSGKTIKFVAQVSDWLAAILTETPLAMDQNLVAQKDGQGFRLTAKLEDTWQLRWWILSQGDGMTIIGPEYLRVEIGRLLKKAWKGYENK